MREIKFRGKRLDNGLWDVGYYVYSAMDGKHCIVDCVWAHVKIDPATVGQYTGLKDKNGVEIYEGDIVKWGHLEGSKERTVRIAVVVNSLGQIVFRCANLGKDFPFGTFAYQNTERALEVIGNIHDNPELLEVDKHE